jgi:predicted RNase H-like HicB family nuclease
MTHQETITTYEYTYTCIFEPEPELEGGFTVTCPALPGLVTYGATLKEARAMASEAIEGYLESLQKDGLPFPISEDEHRDTRREPITVKLATV